MKRVLIYTIIALFLQSCGLNTQKNYTPDWEPPITTHSLLSPETIPMQTLWEQQAFVLSNASKNVQCASIKDVVILVGSPNSSDIPKVFALNGENGTPLWSFQGAGILAHSKEDLFIGFEKTIYSINPRTGTIKWQKQLPSIRNITGVMYYDKLVFINGSGTYGFYVLDNSGEIISKYANVSGFRSDYSKVPFYPTAPFGTVLNDNILIAQAGSGLYYGDIYDRVSNKKLWQVDGNSISNFIIINEYVVWISSDDSIKVADIYSGEILGSITIIPSIDFFDPNPNKQYAGYYLCGDSQTNNIYVVLGDSRQIFAIKFMKK